MAIKGHSSHGDDCMHAFIEWQCDCRCAGIVRSGRSAIGYGSDWDFAVVISMRGNHATIKALVRPLKFPWWLRWLEWLMPIAPFTMAHARATFAALIRENLTFEWDRLGQDPYRVSLSPNGIRGKFIMSVAKEKCHDIADMFNADGTLNEAAAHAGLGHFLGQKAAGHVSIVNGKAAQVEQPSGDVDITISFTRQHH